MFDRIFVKKVVLGMMTTVPFFCYATPPLPPLDTSNSFTLPVVEMHVIWSDGKMVKKTQYKNNTVRFIKPEQQAVGTKHYISGRQEDQTPWQNTGNPSCSDWTPSPDSYWVTERFGQSRMCTQKQTSTKKIFNTWTDGRLDLISIQTLTRSSNNSESRQSVGIRGG